MSEKILIDINELSEILSIGKTKINEMQKNGILPNPIKQLSQTKRLWLKSDIEKWVDDIAQKSQKVS